MYKEVEQNITAFKAIAEKMGYKAVISDRNTHVTLQDDDTRAIVNFEISQEGLVYPYVSVRTLSWDLPGERTDANEILSVLIAGFLRINNYASCRIWDIPHPVEVPETEVYARYLVPDQSYILANQLDVQSLERIEKFCAAIRYLCLVFPRLFDWDVTEPSPMTVGSNYSYQNAKLWAKNVACIVGEKFNEDKIQYCQRINPCWKHYRSIQTGLTIYKSPQLSSSLISLLSKDIPWKNLSISTGTIYDSGDILNFISIRESRFIEKILKGLNNTKHLNKIVYIPLENIFIAASGDYVAFLQREAGRKRFEYEREKAREKHSKDTEILFPSSEFIWSSSIDGSRFELFIMDLLKLEQGVRWVRQVSNTNEPDGGKDILCDWFTQPPSNYFDEHTPPYVIRQVIVQCKAFKDAVPKSKVTDIRDIVEHHNANGFFLAVSSYLSNTLTEHLYKMKTDGKIWVDWWTRSEIEERIRINRHIVSKYPDIVQFK
ncbi:restriction endonuclease [Pelatocladus sp. BLCC-F211]|uniref:restriction endonuclease n=1 Tax=Pelatocladus sp. BLCC-F211 TaxID=3342752 RepID=UPI0035BA5889